MRTSIVASVVGLSCIAGCTTETPPAQAPTCNCPSAAVAASPNAKEPMATSLPPIAEKRLEALDKAWEQVQLQIRSGKASVIDGVVTARLWHDVFRDSRVGGPLYLQRAEKHLAMMKTFAELVETQHKMGIVDTSAVQRTQYLMLEAEQWLDQAKAGEAP